MEVGYRTAVAARWSDMDSFRHINNAAVVTLLEEARIPWLFAPERPTAALADGVFLADLRVRYRGQLVLEDSPVEVVMWISRIRAADFTIVAELRPPGHRRGGARIGGQPRATGRRRPGESAHPPALAGRARLPRGVPT
ncbi:hypothetical protein GCM10023353_27760 [Tomitella cavernea]|uniref:Acyl-CoA thioesterase n=1 Tax=Tomitella cavernea TaxID=1387982 RepID=A0ABP9CX11_9ACTN